jgi:7-keto-8-aminopelargonate synthetase-like enzyme
MTPQLEALMAQGRSLGITQRAVADTSADGRLLRLSDGQEVLSFATCNYLGLDRDPRLADGAVAAIRRSGVSFSASRCFVTSPCYGDAEDGLTRIFGRPVVLGGSTTLIHSAALPILVEAKDVVLHDHQVHHSVQAALIGLPSRPRVEVVPHNDFERLEIAIERAIAGGAERVWYCADGIYSMLGDRLPVDRLVTLMERYPRLWAYLDDAHGMSWCGSRGGGSLIDARLPVERTVVATSLSKGFGAGGGLVAVPDQRTKERIENLGPSLMFSIQLPPPVLGAVAASARIHLSDEIGSLQAELAEKMELVRSLVAEDEVLAPWVPKNPGQPTPVNYVVLGDAPRVVAAARKLLDRGILVNPVAYPAVPRTLGGLRWTLTRAHTEADLVRLVGELGQVVRATPSDERPRPRVRIAAPL